MNKTAYVDNYIHQTRMDDIAKLTAEDLNIGEGLSFTNKERESICEKLRARSSEFQMISPEEEMREITRITSMLSQWMYRKARQEDCVPYHPFSTEDNSPDRWPSLLSVRKGSALGCTIALAYQVVNHVQLHDRYLIAGIGLHRTIQKLGIQDAHLHGEFWALSRVSQNYPFWSKGDEAMASALADTIQGKTIVPPHITACMVRYPNLWKSHAQNLGSIVCSNKKHVRNFQRKHLKKGWTPEMVIALHDLYSVKSKLSNKHKEEIQDLQDLSNILTSFLVKSGVSEVVLNELEGVFPKKETTL